MRLIFAWWNILRMHRAIWHRQQHERLLDLVADYLEGLPHD